ncbi:GGDEF domain-containing protein [Motilibacter rhizosphaerae]|uniref:GGDEF domain-containing protein n=1 Tax=Motilibacter rhizosphaerae TaxID=598652 RepID=UPI00102B986B|nr:GGDEF domain-containing protein [Motilibacter rhizosphaerae]
MHQANRAHRAYLGVGVLLVVAHVLAQLAWGPLVGQLAYLTVDATAVVALGWRAARSPRRARSTWLLLALGMLATAVGDATWTLLLTVLHRSPFPSVADVAYLAQYPLLAAALVVLARRRGGLHGREAHLDSAVLTVGLGLLVWVGVVRPALADADPGLGTVVSLAYPVGDVLLLATAARLWAGGGRRSTSLRMLLGGLVATLLSDVWFAQLGDSGGDVLALAASLPFLAAYLLLGAAALHPDAAALTDPQPPPAEPLPRRRLLALTAASLLSPVTLAVELALGRSLDGWAVAASSAVLFLLVVARMAGLLRRLQDQAVRLERLSRTDALTGLPNRRSGDAELDRALHACRAAGAPLAVAMVDLDHFKQFNDSRGHQAGDRLLVGCAAAWREQLPRSATLARYGGEEFLVVLPGRSAEQAVVLLGRLTRVTPEGRTFSAGAAEWDGRELPEALVDRADQALYAAKRAGRARVERAQPATAA